MGGKAPQCSPQQARSKKHAVHALVERGGEVRAKHVADVTAKTLREALVTQASRKSTLNTDEALTYYWVGREFAAHGSVNHAAHEYVSKDGKTTTNSAESFFAILKRKVYGTHHAISEAHLHRYVAEAEFMFNNRIALDIDDTERANNALKGIGGKRLTYRPVGQA
ncbi:MAG: IS1595 family transposase [Hyphomicrobiaceae bacterium]